MKTDETLDPKEFMTVETTDGTQALVRKEDIRKIQEDYKEEAPVEYELIFDKYPTLQSLEFKQKRMIDYVGWQRDMIRLYTDSHLAETSALPNADIYCIENSFDIKAKGKGKLKAKFVIKSDGETVDEHKLVLNKVDSSDINRIIDAHIFLLEMALFGNTSDYKDEKGPLHKFCMTINRPEVLTSTVKLLDAIADMKLDGGITTEHKEEEVE